jgi:uncharacterized protein YkwD
MYFRLFLLITLMLSVAPAAFSQGSGAMAFRAAGGFGVVPVSASGGALTTSAVRTLEREAFNLINAERGRAGLASLEWSDKVAEVARVHSANMAEYNFFSHKGLDGLMVNDRAERMRMGAWSAIGENIAFMKGFDNPVQTAVDKWLQSPSHKRNLLNPQWTETAIGLAVTPDGKYYFTQVFVRN